MSLSIVEIAVGVLLIAAGVAVGMLAFFVGHAAGVRESLSAGYPAPTTAVEALLQNRAKSSKKKSARSKTSSTVGYTKKSSSDEKSKRKGSPKASKRKPADLDIPNEDDDDYNSGMFESYLSPNRSDVEEGTYDEGPSIRTNRDLVLLQTFYAVLRDGLVIKLHTSRKVKQVTLTLDGDMLKWKYTGAALSNRKYRLDVHNIDHAEMGKTTPVLEFAEVADDLCFSLILADGSSVDFEASSAVERDAMFQGFVMTLQDVRDPNRDPNILEGFVLPVQEVRDRDDPQTKQTSQKKGEKDKKNYDEDANIAEDVTSDMMGFF